MINVIDVRHFNVVADQVCTVETWRPPVHIGPYSVEGDNKTYEMNNICIFMYSGQFNEGEGVDAIWNTAMW